METMFSSEFTNCSGSLILLSDIHALSLFSLHKMLADTVSRELVSSSTKVVHHRRGKAIPSTLALFTQEVSTAVPFPGESTIWVLQQL